MNLGELRTQVKDFGFEDISADELTEALNEAYYEATSAASWPFLEKKANVLLTIDGDAGALTAPGPSGGQVNLRIHGTAKIPLQPITGVQGEIDNIGVARIREVIYGGLYGKRLGYLTHDDFFSFARGGTTNSGGPRYYTVWNSYLWVAPAPREVHSTHSVRYTREVAPLQYAADRPVIPTRFHRVLVHGAVARLAMEDDDLELAAAQRDIFEKKLEDMKTVLMERVDDTRAEVGAATNTLNYLTQELRHFGFSGISDSDATALINDALLDICSRYQWPFLRTETTLTTIAGNPNVSLPADCRKPIMVNVPELGSQVFFEDLSDHRFQVRPSHADGKAAPQRYSLLAGSNGSSFLRLWPVPDRSYQLLLLYERRVPRLTNPDDVVAFPQDHTRAIVLGAAYRAAMRNFADADKGTFTTRVTALKADYDAAVERMRNDLLVEQRDRAASVRITQTDLWDY